MNEEVTELQSWLAAAPQILADGGAVVAISFHSLEDRAVKNAFRNASKGCVRPPAFPVCRCGKGKTLELLGRRAVRPSADEIATNPRAASARLRAARRLPRAC